MFSLQTYKSEKNIKPLLIMRNSTFRKFLLFLLLLPTYLCTTAWAQLSELEQGKVYRFVNVGQSSYALAATTTKGATGSTVTTGSTQADYPQLWCVTEVKDNSGTKTYRLRHTQHAQRPKQHGPLPPHAPRRFEKRGGLGNEQRINAVGHH